MAKLGYANERDAIYDCVRFIRKEFRLEAELGGGRGGNNIWFIARDPDGTIEVYSRWARMRDARAVGLVALHRRESGVELEIRSDLAGPGTHLRLLVEQALRDTEAT
jgi:hypothetical protein